MTSRGKTTHTPRLIEGPVGGLLVKLTVQMLFGIVSMVIFNLVDTLFVGHLGTVELAALSFTLPVVLVIHNIALGIGIGASAVISRAIGEKDTEKVRCLTTQSLLLSVIIVACIVTIGLFTVKPLFLLLGASEEILPFILEYMKIWYWDDFCGGPHGGQ